MKLVLDGNKRATSSTQEEYILANEEEPKVGDYSIVTDFNGNPKCIIQIKEILKLTFQDMTFDLCKLEGEDLSLKSWQDNHINVFTTVGKQVGYTFLWDMEMIFEVFEVVHE